MSREELRAKKVPNLNHRVFEVIELDSGEPLTNATQLVWGPVGPQLMDPGEDPLFTPEHFDREKDYLVLVIECDSAIRMEER